MGMNESVIELRPRETVVHAVDFSAMVAWYRDVLGFRVVQLFDDGFHFCNLETPSGIRIGIASAQEMELEPADRSKNTVVLQFEVDDLKAFFERVSKGGGSVTGGPSFNQQDGFWFGSFCDLEGNPFWVVDGNCP